MDVDELTAIMGKLTVQGHKKNKRKIKNTKKKKKKKKGSTSAASRRQVKRQNRQKGGAAGAIMGMVARGVVRWTPQLLRFTAKNTLKYVPRMVMSSAAQSAAETAIAKEIKRRRKEDWTMLGSIRRAAAEKYMDLQRPHLLHDEEGMRSYARIQKAWAAKRRAHLSRKRSAANWQGKIARAKSRALRQQHLDAAVDRSRRNRGLISFNKLV